MKVKKHILDYIPMGKKNAISVQQLAELSGAHSESSLRKDIAELRKSGELICSSSCGYYRPATLADFIKRMESHAIGVFQAIKSAREAMKQIEGQQHLENI